MHIDGYVFARIIIDGKTYTALINGAELSAGQPEKIVKVMKAASDETMEIVKTVAG